MSESDNEICTMRIELVGSDPPIWREVEVPTSMTLRTLHEVVQAAMGWRDYHLWQFTVRGQRYGLPTKEGWGLESPVDARRTSLASLLRRPRTVMTYVYDFGDDWEHRLVLTKIREGEPGIVYPRFVAGERNAPPEDCGGIFGFYDNLDILADPRHPQHAEVRGWLGDYDPDRLDATAIAKELGRIGRRRRRAPTRQGEG